MLMLERPYIHVYVCPAIYTYMYIYKSIWYFEVQASDVNEAPKRPPALRKASLKCIASHPEVAELLIAT